MAERFAIAWDAETGSKWHLIVEQSRIGSGVLVALMDYDKPQTFVSVELTPEDAARIASVLAQIPNRTIGPEER